MWCIFVHCFFFFFKQKTAYEMRISDWSSDVCSSDLLAIRLAQRLTGGVEAPLKASGIALVDGKLRLSLDAGWHHLAGESVERRLRVLAHALDAKPELVLL